MVGHGGSEAISTRGYLYNIQYIYDSSVGKCADHVLATRPTARQNVMASSDCRVGGWRASFRVRWLLRRFRSGPQSGSHGRVSSPPLSEPGVRISRTGLSSGIMHLAHGPPERVVGEEPVGPVARGRPEAAARQPSCLPRRFRCAAGPVHAPAASNRSGPTPSLPHVTRSEVSALKAGL